MTDLGETSPGPGFCPHPLKSDKVAFSLSGDLGEITSRNGEIGVIQIGEIGVIQKHLLNKVAEQS